MMEFKLADIGEGIAEVEILQWYVKPGDTLKQFDKVCEVESDKATVEITSRFDGVVRSLDHEVGAMAKVGQSLLTLETDGPDPTIKAAPEKRAPPPNTLQRTESIDATIYPPGKAPAITDPIARSDAAGSSGRHKMLATPAVRRMIKENNLDIAQIEGTGKEGRVLKSDVLDYINGGGESSEAVEQHISSGHSSAKSLQDTVVPIKGIQKQMVKSMKKALLVPHFNLMEEFTMNELMKLRSSMKPSAEARGLKLSYLPFILKATSLALRQYPSLNATVDDECTQVTHRARHNISVAMDTPKGLLVPNIKDVQDKSIFEIAADLQRLQALGADNKLGPDELSGGTFSLSNIGVLGGTYASPVIMVPQVAIGAIGRMQKVPRFDAEDNVVSATIMNVSWAADHRVVDGATMARFSNQLKEYVENPISMLADMA
jgi:2-oxoisovalerate dehydrogenase E2 component (dihydrolipoyl transacylase)